VEVSRPVSQEVSLANREIDAPRKRIRNNRTRSCGLYLVRSGNTFLFQMKVPNTICAAKGKGPLRLSLGSTSAQDARAAADRLAAVLRYWFSMMEPLRLSSSFIGLVASTPNYACRSGGAGKETRRLTILLAPCGSSSLSPMTT